MEKNKKKELIPQDNLVNNSIEDNKDYIFVIGWHKIPMKNKYMKTFQGFIFKKIHKKITSAYKIYPRSMTRAQRQDPHQALTIIEGTKSKCDKAMSKFRDSNTFHFRDNIIKYIKRHNMMKLVPNKFREKIENKINNKDSTVSYLDRATVALLMFNINFYIEVREKGEGNDKPPP